MELRRDFIKSTEAEPWPLVPGTGGAENAAQGDRGTGKDGKMWTMGPETVNVAMPPCTSRWFQQKKKNNT